MDLPACIRMTDMSFTVGDNLLFNQFNLEIPAGCCTVFMGPAGSGKSSLLKIAAGLIPPQDGTVEFQGKNWDIVSEHENIELRAKMGFVFQNGALWANKSIYQNIELPLLYHHQRLTKDEVRNKIHQISKELGIEDQLPFRPSQLSLGEQKIVSFVRAIVLDPEVLFLDDPTASLDSQSRDVMLSHVESLHKKKRTLILVTQDPTVTSQLADRLVILKNGVLLANGPFQEVTRSSDPEIGKILTSVLSQTATFSDDILDLLSNG